MAAPRQEQTLIYWQLNAGEWTPRIFRTATEWTEYKAAHREQISKQSWRIERRGK